MDMGARRWLAYIAICIGAGIAALIVFLLIDVAWYLWGALGTLFLAGLVILGVFYLVDRRTQRPFE